MKFLIIVCFVAFSLTIYANSFYSEAEENIGEEIFLNSCQTCHTGGFKGWITGAPDIDDLEEWEPYLKKDIKVLIKNVYKGVEGHEIKGGCDSCTEQQIKSAIDYIISTTNNEKKNNFKIINQNKKGEEDESTLAN